MKYIRTYETEEKFLTDKDSTSRGFRLKPTLYKYSEAGDHVHLELDDPRKHGDSTYMEITLDSDVEFSFYIGNTPGDTQTTMTCTIDWGDGTVETKTITKDDKGFKLSHNYTAGSYKIELYDVERDYSVIGDNGSLISHPSSVNRVVLGSGVVIIGEFVFSTCDALTSVHIPESITIIGDYTFDSCTSLTSVYIPEGVTSIGKGAFEYCESLTSINIPEGVTSIGDYAFEYCDALTSVHIPESITIIGDYTFTDCSKLTYVVLPNNATIHPNAFDGAGVELTIDGITYYRDALIAGRYTFNSIGFLTFYLNDNPYSYAGSVDSVVAYSCDKSKSGDLIIPSTISYNGVAYDVTRIENTAFSYCKSLASVTIPEGVTSIGVSAFQGCTSLSSISSFNTTAPTLVGSLIFSRLPTNGTLHIKSGATGYDVWLSKLPSGWVIVEDL